MPKLMTSTPAVVGMSRRRPAANVPVRESDESAEMRFAIDRLRGRSGHCSRLAQHAHSSKIAAEFEQLARDYEDDAARVEMLMRRNGRAAS